jgi:Domain of unknown function (DUF4136)
MKLRYLSILFWAILLSACASSLRVNSDFDPNTNFSSFKSYQWLKVDMPNDLWNQRAMDAIDSTLASKGWTKVEDGGEVGIVALGTTKQEQSINTFYNSFGAGWGWGWRGWGGAATTTVSTYQVGTLIVDLFDAKRSSSFGAE